MKYSAFWKKVIIVIMLFSMCVSFVSAQSSFPEGSTSGRTDMDPKMTPVTVPLVDLQLRQPETGKEVAFSLQVLLLLLQMIILLWGKLTMK